MRGIDTETSGILCLKNLLLILAICLISTNLYASETKEEKSYPQKTIVSSLTDDMTNRFEVEISGQNLTVPLPEKLQLFLNEIILKPGIPVKIELDREIPFGAFFIQGTQYLWLGGSKLYNVQTKKRLFYTIEEMKVISLPPFFSAVYPETEKRFPEFFDFGVQGGQF